VEESCWDYFYMRYDKLRLDRTILILDGRVLKPTREVRNLLGYRGLDIYCLKWEEWDRVWDIWIGEDPSGRAIAFGKNVPREIIWILWDAWVYRRVSEDELERLAVDLYLKYSTKM